LPHKRSRDKPRERLLLRQRDPPPIRPVSRPEPRDTMDSKPTLRTLSRLPTISSPRKRDKESTFQEIPKRRTTSELDFLKV